MCVKNGSTELAEVPCPRVGRGSLLIRTSRSLVSAGTERVRFRQGQPDDVTIQEQPVHLLGTTKHAKLAKRLNIWERLLTFRDFRVFRSFLSSARLFRLFLNRS